MRATSFIVAWALAAGCGLSAEDAERIDTLEARITQAETLGNVVVQDLTALQGAHDQLRADHDALAARVDTLDAALGGGEGNDGLTQQLESIQQSVDAHAASLVDHDGRLLAATAAREATAAALAALDGRLYDEVEGDVVLLQSAVGALATQADALGVGVLDNASGLVGVSDRVGDIEDDYLTSADASTLQAGIDANADDISANTTAIAGNAADIGANATDIAGNATDIATNATAVTGNAADIDANADAILENDGDIASNAADIGANETAIATNASGLTALDGRVDDIENDYLPELDDLFDLVVADPANDELEITATVLATAVEASGTVEAGRLTGPSLYRGSCGGGTYSCTPQQCLAHCQARDMRMATLDEALAYASAGNDDCAWRWYLDADDPNAVHAAYPMYSNTTSGGCGPTGTGNRPRFGGGPSRTSWSSSTRYGCACSSNN